MKQYELLSPAGDFSGLIAAINAGADAVYLAGKSFGARAYAGNFDTEELMEALDYAHLFSKKIYLTLNTLIKEKEFCKIQTFLKPFYEHGLDGVIIQDLGLIPLLKKEFPLLKLHGSTQMTISNYRSAAWLKEQGICRVVPSRELSLEELREIREKGAVEVEAFIHGAMCYSYSGQCLFSSFLGGRSGNRGRCAQPCRLPYKVCNEGKCISGKNDIYPLSLKDLCSLPYIYELMDAGIDSFKIEGRMKSPEYVAGVTAVYRKYMDLYMQGERKEISKEDLELLSHLYIRSDMKDGYFNKHNGKDMISILSPSYRGCNEKLIQKLHEEYCERKKKVVICGQLKLETNANAQLTVYTDTTYVTVYGDVLQEAKNRPLTEEEARKQIEKTGNSLFSFKKLDIEISGSIFIPVKSLNELRREALDALSVQLLQPYMRNMLKENGADKTDTDTMIPSKSKNKTSFRLYASVMSKMQLDSVLNSKTVVERIYIPADLLYLSMVSADDILKKAAERKVKLYCSLPRIIRKRDEGYLNAIRKYIQIFDGVQVKSLEGLSFLEESGYRGKLVTDYSVYQWNRSSLHFLHSFCDEFTYPLELSLRENCDLSDRSGEYVIYGRTPMMITANCIQKTMGNCRKNNNSFKQSLKDRYCKELPVYVNCIHCYNEIFNAVPMSLHKELQQLIQAGFSKFRLDFTDENKENVDRILDYYGKKADNLQYTIAFPIKEYTQGHFKEGAL